MTVNNKWKTPWYVEKEIPEKEKVFNFSNFKHILPWILYKRPGTLIFHWAACCWPLGAGWCFLVEVTVFSLSLPLCSGFGALWPSFLPSPRVKLIRPGGPQAACTRLYHCQGSRSPGLVWPSTPGCLDPEWVCGFLLFRERMTVAMLAVAQSSSEPGPLTPRRVTRRFHSLRKCGTSWPLRAQKGDHSGTAVLPVSSIPRLAVVGMELRMSGPPLP